MKRPEEANFDRRTELNSLQCFQVKGNSNNNKVRKLKIIETNKFKTFKSKQIVSVMDFEVSEVADESTLSVSFVQFRIFFCCDFFVFDSRVSSFLFFNPRFDFDTFVVSDSDT